LDGLSKWAASGEQEIKLKNPWDKSWHAFDKKEIPMNDKTDELKETV
jgi:hypothetical protein